jgi:hypothetical protein
MTFTHEEIQAMNQGKNKPKGFTPKAKGDRPAQASSSPPQTASNNIPAAREAALALSNQSHDAMKALQGRGLENAAAYIQRQQSDRNAIVEKVSDAIAYLCDPDVLEADIMSAAAAKVAARSNAWGYTEPTVDLDTLFALPTPSPRLIEEAP